MELKPNNQYNQKSDWLNCAETLNDIEAAQINGGAEIGSIDSKADPQSFAQQNAEFSAEAQIFKLSQEAISTQIKSIGEAQSSVARKS